MRGKKLIIKHKNIKLYASVHTVSPRCLSRAKAVVAHENLHIADMEAWLNSKRMEIKNLEKTKFPPFGFDECQNLAEQTMNEALASQIAAAEESQNNRN